MQLSSSLRAVGIIEASKGLLVLVVGFGLLSFAHHDVQHAARELISHLHLDPANRYPQIFIDAADHLDDTRLTILAAFAALYAAVRLAIGYGLWHLRSWAEWLAALSGAIYIPFEIIALSHGVTPLRVVTFLVNVLIVVIMVFALRQRRNAREQTSATTANGSGRDV
jgi:uncharacterized membrane protein (DUF2068 family)